MGQVIKRLHSFEQEVQQRRNSRGDRDGSPHKSLADLNDLPPELGYLVLKNLDATDLCLASCVWQNLAEDEVLWHGLCRSQWGHVSAYRKRTEDPEFSFKKLYLLLDEATLTFNADCNLGFDYLLEHQLVDNTPEEIAKFLHAARPIDWNQRRIFLQKRQDVLDVIVQLQNFENQFLPNALRSFFSETTPPNQRHDYLSLMVEKFSQRFSNCNPQLGLTADTVYVLCYSLIMLSVDLASPHIKNKMSKREFIKNTRRAANGINDEFAGHLYDNIYLIGHITPKA